MEINKSMTIHQKYLRNYLILRSSKECERFYLTLMTFYFKKSNNIHRIASGGSQKAAYLMKSINIVMFCCAYTE